MLLIGSDHAGFFLKQEIINHLNKEEVSLKDYGCFSAESCDYPDIAKLVCGEIKDDDKAILVCGTGVGMSIVANKIKGIRAVCASDNFSVKFSRLHNNSNVLCIGARVLGTGLALELVETFIKTPFEGGRHLKRLMKIEN